MRRGAHPRLFNVLRDGIEADLVIEHAIEFGDKVADARWHPLAATVRRDLTNLITEFLDRCVGGGTSIGSRFRAEGIPID
jgi:hypothetical protein